MFYVKQNTLLLTSHTRLLPPCLPSKLYLRQGRSFALLPGGTIFKTPTSFSVSSRFLRILQLPGYNQQNGKLSWLPLLSYKISLKDTSVHISINSKCLYLSLKCFLNFLSNVYIPPCVRKIVIFMMFTFLENALSRDVFTHARPHSKLVPKFLPSRPIVRRKLLILQGSILSKIGFTN